MKPVPAYRQPCFLPTPPTPDGDIDPHQNPQLQPLLRQLLTYLMNLSFLNTVKVGPPFFLAFLALACLPYLILLLAPGSDECAQSLRRKEDGSRSGAIRLAAESSFALLYDDRADPEFSCSSMESVFDRALAREIFAFR
ncbi:hypothetical protein ACFE04_011481 [Oxalis oulophora]